MPRRHRSGRRARRTARHLERRAALAEPACVDVGLRDGREPAWRRDRKRSGVHPLARSQSRLHRDGLPARRAQHLPDRRRCPRAAHRAHRALHPRRRDGTPTPLVPLPQLVHRGGPIDRLGLRNRRAVLGRETRRKGSRRSPTRSPSKTISIGFTAAPTSSHEVAAGRSPPRGSALRPHFPTPSCL